MAAGDKGQAKFPGLAVIILEVADLDKAVEKWSSLGLGPWLVQERSNEAIMQGRKVSNRARWAMAPLGPTVLLELAQILEGEHVHNKFLRERGEGLSALSFNVENLDEWLAKCKEMGIEPLLTQARKTGGRFAYMDTEKEFNGVMIEFLEGELTGLDKVEWGHRFK